jgi:CRP-like cAMP-binding protein
MAMANPELANRDGVQRSRLEELAVRRQFRRGEEICARGQPAANWFRVIAGAARRCIIRSDGRRQIVGLLLPGDFFGFAAGDEYDFGVEAVPEETVVALYSRRRAQAMADSDPAVGHEVHALTLSVIAQLQTQLLIVGRMTAAEKVGSFLVEMSNRFAMDSPGPLTLPVSRYDIADYLGISAETVSRALSGLNHRGLIAFSGTRRLRIVNRHALEDSGRRHVV